MFGGNPRNPDRTDKIKKDSVYLKIKKRPSQMLPTSVRASIAGATQNQVHSSTLSGRKERKKMKIPCELISELEDVHFKYERLEALLHLLHTVTAEVAEVAEIPEDSLNYSLYEICLNMHDNNQKLQSLTEKLIKADLEKKEGTTV